ncbi:unnamed protein product, partial [Sphagnum compactum]
KRDRPLAGWLFFSAGLVFGVVIIGGVTRLTESGLSMVDWSLLHYKPPRSEDEWTEYFDKYKTSPEYQLSNVGMSVDDFKKIYYMEYGHRMLGRVVGACYIFPMIYFMWTRRSTMSIQHRVLLFSVGGLLLFQGFLGWYMVKSGLDPEIIERGDVPRVSPYRLAAHLTTAFAIYLLMLRGGMIALNPTSYFGECMLTMGEKDKLRKLRSTVTGSAHLIGITAISGAFVAGLDAGLVYNTFPKMGNHWVPDDFMALRPKWRNFVENPSAVQFVHRALATLSFLSILRVGKLGWKSIPHIPQFRQVKLGLVLFVLTGFTQVSLGISTLLFHVPIPLAAAHQAGSLTLLTISSWLLHILRRF